RIGTDAHEALPAVQRVAEQPRALALAIGSQIQAAAVVVHSFALGEPFHLNCGKASYRLAHELPSKSNSLEIELGGRLSLIHLFPHLQAGCGHPAAKDCERESACKCLFYSHFSNISEAQRKSAKDGLSEGVGFEPTIRFPVYTLSKRAPSATRPPLRRGRCGQYSHRPRPDNPMEIRGCGLRPMPNAPTRVDDPRQRCSSSRDLPRPSPAPGRNWRNLSAALPLVRRTPEAEDVAPCD